MRRIPFVLVLVVCSALSTFAADRKWTGLQSPNWSNPANWSPQGVPAPGESLEFPGIARNLHMNNDLPPGTAVGAMSFLAEGSLNGNLLTLMGDVAFVSSPSAAPFSFGVDIKLGAPITIWQAIGKPFNGAVDLNGHKLTFYPAYSTSLRGPVRGDGIIWINGTGLNITGSGTFSGTIDGRLNVVGSFPNASVRSPRFSGEGVVGPVHAGLLYPGDAPPLPSGGEHVIGTLQTGSLAINPAGAKENGGAHNSNPKGRLLIDLVPGSESDQLIVRGTVSLDASLEVTLLGTPSDGQSFTIIDNDGTDPVSGRFTGLSEGAMFTVDSSTMWVSYSGGDGNDVVLNAGAPPPLTKTWTGATSDLWSDPSNWSPAGVPAQGDALLFPTGARLNTTNDLSGFIAGPMKFDDDYVLGGNGITLTGDLLFGGSSVDFICNASLTLQGSRRFQQAGSSRFNGAINMGNNLLTIETKRTSIHGPLSGNSEFLAEGEGLSVVGDGPFAGRFRGRLDIVGSYPNATVDGLLGASTGSGTVAAIATLSLSPGSTDPWSTTDSHEPGTLTTAFLSIINDGFFDINASGPSDRMNVNGPVFLYGTLHVTPSGAFAANQAFTIIENDGTDAVYQTFLGLPEGSVFYAGETKFRVSYVGGDGNDVVLTYVGPPPVVAAPTVTTLTQNKATTEVHQPVTFTASVTAASGVPSGTVTFSEGATTLGSAPLQNGVAELTTATLSEGTHSIVASYAGNASFESSASAPIVHTVVKGKPNITITALSSGLIHGDSASFRVDVSSASNDGRVPAGSVTLSVDGTTAGTGTLVSGSVTIAVSTLSAGSHTITAVYAGNDEFESATASITQSVAKATTIMSLESDANPATAGATVQITIRVSAPDRPSLTVDGSVVVRKDSQVVSEVQLTGNTATVAIGPLAAGEYEISASYAGSNGFEASSATLTQRVDPPAKTATTTALTQNRATTEVHQPVTFTATVASSNGTPSGTVTFTDEAATLGTVPLQNGVAELTTKTLSEGTHSIVATYSGSESYESSASAPLAHRVVKGDPKVTVTALSSGLIHGDAASFRVEVSSSSNDERVPAGGVTLSVNGTAAGNGALVSGAATIAVPALSAGAHTIAVAYDGNDEFKAATASITQSVAKAATSMSLESDVNPARPGTTINLTIRVNAPDRLALPIAGAVVIRSNGQIVSEVQLAGNIATARIGPLNVGEYQLTATYAGNDGVEAAQSALTQRVVKDDPTATATTLTQNRAVTEMHQPVTFTAKVTSLNGVPAGTVTFTDGTATIGTAPLVNGEAELRIQTLAFGAHTIVATYSDSDSFAASASAPVVHTVVKGKPHLTLISPAPALVYGDPASFRVELASIQGRVPTGSVTLKVDGSMAGTGMLNGGEVTISVPLLTAGQHAISAVYEGNDSFDSATATITQAVAKAKTIVSLDAGAEAALAGTLVDFAILVNASNPELRIDGTVVVRGQDEVEVPLTANVARARIGPFEAGEYQITATYPGSQNFEAGNGVLTLSVIAPEPLHATPVAYTYATEDGMALQATYYAPLTRNAARTVAGDAANEPWPLILWIPGDQAYDAHGGDVAALRLTGKGYAVASIGYRPAGRAPFPAQIHDLEQAVRWLRAHAAELNVNPDRFIAWGTGAGAHLATLLGTGMAGGPADAPADARIQAVISWAGIGDPAMLQEDALACSTTDWNAATSPASKLFGCSPSSCSATAGAAAAGRYAGADDAPMLLMHGAADCFVGSRQSERLYEALTRAGVNATLRVIAGVGHEDAYWTSAAFAEVQRFLDTTFKQPSRRRAVRR
jgi:acetyl esterase/lipase